MRDPFEVSTVLQEEHRIVKQLKNADIRAGRHVGRLRTACRDAGTTACRQYEGSGDSRGEAECGHEEKIFGNSPFCCVA